MYNQLINLSISTIDSMRIFAAGCGGSFFGFPTWYKYLNVKQYNVKLIDDSVCTVRLSGINDFWLVGLAVIEIMLRLAMILTIIFVAYSGAKYINARGNAEKLTSAKNTLTDALVGLVIALVATALVNFIGRRFG